MNYVSTVKLGIKWRPEKKKSVDIYELYKHFALILMMYWTHTHTHQQKKRDQKLTDVCLHLLQLCSLIAELASAAANEKGLTFEEAMEDRLCAYARAVAHFPTAVKEVNIGTQFNYYALTV